MHSKFDHGILFFFLKTLVGRVRLRLRLQLLLVGVQWRLFFNVIADHLFWKSFMIIFACIESFILMNLEFGILFMYIFIIFCFWFSRFFICSSLTVIVIIIIIIIVVNNIVGIPAIACCCYCCCCCYCNIILDCSSIATATNATCIICIFRWFIIY
jgi:hypothetical protein